MRIGNSYTKNDLKDLFKTSKNQKGFGYEATWVLPVNNLIFINQS